MKTLFILGSVAVILFLTAPNKAEAQQISHSVTAEASKSWKSFWTQFTAAVKSNNKVTLKRLMVAESEFSNGAEGGTRNHWLKMLDKDRQWGDLQRAVAKGTKPYDSGEKRPWRVTTDGSLLFVFEKSRWRFLGVMGYE